MSLTQPIPNNVALAILILLDEVESNNVFEIAAQETLDNFINKTPTRVPNQDTAGFSFPGAAILNCGDVREN